MLIEYLEYFLRLRKTKTYDFIHMWNLKNKMNKTKSRIRPINTENKRLVVRKEQGGRIGKMSEGEREILDSTYSVSYRNKRHREYGP